MKNSPILCVLAATFLAAPILRAADEKPVKEETVKSERGDLQVMVEADGSLDAVKRKKIKIVPDEFVGPYTIAEITPAGQQVKAGDVVMKLDTVVLERFLRGAHEFLDSAKLKDDNVHEEFEVLKTSNKLKLERAGYDLTLAIRDQKIFQKFGEEQMLKGRELQLKNNEAVLADRQEELGQLEKMYKDTALATETKEIVLDRSRRNVELTKEQIDLLKKSDRQLREYDHPTRKELVDKAVDQKKQDLELLTTNLRLAEIQKGEDVKAADRALRDAQERLARLESDLQLMTVKAPISGILSYRGLEAGDKAMPNVVLAEILDTSHFELKFTASAGDLRLLKTGDKLHVRMPEIPGLELDGKIDEISQLPQPDDKGAVRYPVRAKIDDDKALRVGAHAHIEAAGEKLQNVISIPRGAIVWEEGHSFCRIKKGDSIEKREITLGLGNRERVQVAKGLSENEIIVVKEGKPKQ